jgi:hypothetical protein
MVEFNTEGKGCLFSYLSVHDQSSLKGAGQLLDNK